MSNRFLIMLKLIKIINYLMINNTICTFLKTFKIIFQVYVRMHVGIIFCYLFYNIMHKNIYILYNFFFHKNPGPSDYYLILTYCYYHRRPEHFLTQFMLNRPRQITNFSFSKCCWPTYLWSRTSHHNRLEPLTIGFLFVGIFAKCILLQHNP